MRVATIITEFCCELYLDGYATDGVTIELPEREWTVLCREVVPAGLEPMAVRMAVSGGRVLIRQNVEATKPLTPEALQAGCAAVPFHSSETK